MGNSPSHRIDSLVPGERPRAARLAQGLSAGLAVAAILLAAAGAGGVLDRPNLWLYAALWGLAAGLEAAAAAIQVPDPTPGPVADRRIAAITGLVVLAGSVWLADHAADRAIRSAPALAGAILMLTGGLLRAAAIRSLGSRFSSENVVAPAARLETGGPYRRLAHPSELGLLALTLGAVLLTGDLRSGLLWCAFYLWTLFRLSREERILAAAFGPAFLSYRARTWDPAPIFTQPGDYRP